MTNADTLAIVCLPEPCQNGGTGVQERVGLLVLRGTGWVAEDIDMAAGILWVVIWHCKSHVSRETHSYVRAHVQICMEYMCKLTVAVTHSCIYHMHIIIREVVLVYTHIVHVESNCDCSLRTCK